MEKNKSRECYGNQKEPGKTISKKLLLSPIYVKRGDQKDGDWKLNQEILNREKCTQTSKTIIELALIDERNMSSDSLDSPPANRVQQPNNPPAKKEHDVPPEPNLFNKAEYQHPLPHLSSVNYNYSVDKYQIDSQNQYMASQWVHTEESVPLEGKTFVNGYYVEQPYSDYNLHRRNNQVPTTEYYIEHNPTLKKFTKANKMHCVGSSRKRSNEGTNIEVTTDKSTERNNYFYQEHYNAQYVLNTSPFESPTNLSEKQSMNYVLRSSYTNDIYPTLEEATNKISETTFKSKKFDPGKSNAQSDLMHSHIYDGTNNSTHTQNVSPNVPIVVNIINNKGEQGDTKQFVSQKFEKKTESKQVFQNSLHTFKSQSFIEPLNLKKFEKESGDSRKRLNRSSVIKDKRFVHFCKVEQPVPFPSEVEIERSNSDDLQRRATKFHSRRSNSFMSPLLHTDMANLKGAGKYLIDMPYFDESATAPQNKTKVPFTRKPSLSEDFPVKKADTDSYLPVHNNCSMSTLFLSSEGGLCSIMCHVKSTDWSMALKGLAEIVDLAIICDVELLMPIMSGVNHKLLELLKSPRSHVCRSACQIAGQLFETVKDTRRPEFDDIIYVLLSKTADANKFIRHDANVALDSMVTHVPIFHSVRSVCSKGPSHRNPLVRCAAVRLLICAVVMAGPDTVLNNSANESTRRRIVVNLATFLEDKNLETRRYAERLFKILEKQGNLEFYLKKYLEREKFDYISRVLKLNQKVR